MNIDDDVINKIINRLKQLESQHIDQATEIQSLKKQLSNYIKHKSHLEEESKIEMSSPIIQQEPEIDIERQLQTEIQLERQRIIKDEESILNEKESVFQDRKQKLLNLNFEKFIGENLINKVGILITIIGIGIGAKYSIENNLVSPLTRIVLGYLSGILLVATGVKLLANYKNYASVLIAGGLAVFYFITFFAYSFYDLIPQTLAFGLMFLFTIFSVFAALKLDKQIIAHIGLVGAYGIPFLLSDETGNITFLFSYIAIINIGILAIAVYKYWRYSFYIAFALTWLIYNTWYYEQTNDLDVNFTIGFAFLFFIIFYITFIVNKIRRDSIFDIIDIGMILLNAFVFYGIGYLTLIEGEYSKEAVTLFTLFNAVIHFAFTIFLYKRKLAENKIFYLLSGLVLVFLTISVPIYFDGNWVTSIWIFEALLLFWIGRTKSQKAYEYLAYPLIVFAAGSLTDDWNNAYNYINGDKDEFVQFLFNSTFLTSILFLITLFFINKINFSNPITDKDDAWWDTSDFLNILLPAVFIGFLYLTFFNEIANYWSMRFYESKVTAIQTEYNYQLQSFGTMSLIIYSHIFLILCSFINMKWTKIRSVGKLNLMLNIFGIFMFLTLGLAVLSSLHSQYVKYDTTQIFEPSKMNLYIRYIALMPALILLSTLYFYPRELFMKMKQTRIYNIILAFFILMFLTSELYHILSHFSVEESSKLGITILWSVYSLACISLGIWKNIKHLRIFAIVLFSIALVKLFLYDISHVNTISKTILFVSLGVLLLIISFLYNKYKHLIQDV
ncbi:MAG: DUF2339 domain-containing protein [Saprospiraceae bacterium]|nr:DUF2339 domain-containing protein [Saprospiraceae bacterium]